VDVAFLYQGQRFVWDVDKASINLARHGVSVEKACAVFFDPIVRLEDASTSGEQPDALTGLTEDWTPSLCGVLLEDDGIRIIQRGRLARRRGEGMKTVRERLAQCITGAVR
jgi:uncharacterized protein